MFKALIFDMDGTLVDSERVHCQAWSETLTVYGIDAPPFDAFGKYVGVSDEQMAVEFIASGELGITAAQLVDEKRMAYRSLVPQIPVLSGVEELLHRCRGCYKMAVASSSPYKELMHILEHHGLKSLFEQVVGGDMVSRKKPDPEIYKKVAGLLGLNPEDCLAFEDSQAGVEAAKRAGLTVVAIPQVMSFDHDFSRADAHLDSLLEADDTFLNELAAKRMDHHV